MINVITRTNQRVPFQRKKIENRLKKLTEMEPKLPSVDIARITDDVVKNVSDGIFTSKLDERSIKASEKLSGSDPEYMQLAGRIAVSNLIKSTPDTFSSCIREQFMNSHPTKSDSRCPLISEYHYRLIQQHAEIYDNMVVIERDYDFDYYAFNTLELSYFKKVNGKTLDRISYMFLRVAICLHEDNFELVKNTYDLMSQKYFIHATPTLFNSCSPTQQLASCFLMVNNEDSIDGLYKTFHQMANISKQSGGIGFSYHDVRSNGSYVAGTNGKSRGISRFLKVANDTALAVDQGGKRNGAFACYLEVHHADLEEFIELRSIGGHEDSKCRNLFLGLWISDLFFERVNAKPGENQNWSLFCPQDAPGLNLVWGDEYKKKYEEYEKIPGLAKKTMNAKSLYMKMIQKAMGGGLYFLSKDSSNRKSNQHHLGTIQCSNLCTEIIQYSDPNEISVCTLASISLPKYITTNPRTGKKEFDFVNFMKVVRVMTRNLDKVIDKNHYPPTGDDYFEIVFPDLGGDPTKALYYLEDMKRNPESYKKTINRSQKASQKHRPISIGVQGLADAFCLLGMPFISEESKALNKQIFECMYYAALSESIQIAKESGYHESYPGSPISNGMYQFTFWGVKPEQSELTDWIALDEERKKYGVRNSLLVGLMPTKSTSHIVGNSECFEPFQNRYRTKTLSGEYDIINRHLVNALKSRNLWDDKMENAILRNRGSVQNIAGFPEDLKPLFKTVWEIPLRDMIDMVVDRAHVIDQSQSLNLYFEYPADTTKVMKAVNYAWKRGLKTLMYYCHIRSSPISLTHTGDSTLSNRQALESSTVSPDVSISVESAPAINPEKEEVVPQDVFEDDTFQEQIPQPEVTYADDVCYLGKTDCPSCNG